MKWISKHSPIYIYMDDEWERETDHKVFKPDEKKKGWVSEDGEIVHWNPKAKVMRKMSI